MKKSQKFGRLIFAILFIGTLLSYSVINAWEAGEELEAELRSFQIRDFKDDISKLNAVMEEQVWRRYDFIEAYGAIQLLMGKKEENSFDNVKDRADYLFSGNFWPDFGDDQKMLAERMRRLMDALAEKDTRVGFVLCPEKTVREELRYPGIPYSSFETLGDDLLRWLDYYSVPYLDLRETMENSGLSYEETWFRTDHHWTPRAAFEGYRDLVGWMNAEFGAQLDPDGITRSLSNYEQICYSASMLGSQGRDAGLVYSGGMEDYTALVPKEAGSYRWKHDHADWREGSFTEAFLMEDLYSAGPYKLNAGKYYLNEVAENSRQLNQEITGGKDILLLRDSFASPVGAFLAQNFERVDMLWSMQYSEEELDQYLEDNSYDYVLVMLYPDNLSEASFPFFTERTGTDEEEP